MVALCRWILNLKISSPAAQIVPFSIRMTQ